MNQPPSTSASRISLPTFEVGAIWKLLWLISEGQLLSESHRREAKALQERILIEVSRQDAERASEGT